MVTVVCEKKVTAIESAKTLRLLLDRWQNQLHHPGDGAGWAMGQSDESSSKLESSSSKAANAGAPLGWSTPTCEPSPPRLHSACLSSKDLLHSSSPSEGLLCHCSALVNMQSQILTGQGDTREVGHPLHLPCGIWRNGKLAEQSRHHHGKKVWAL